MNYLVANGQTLSGPLFLNTFPKIGSLEVTTITTSNYKAGDFYFYSDGLFEDASFEAVLSGSPGVYYYSNNVSFTETVVLTPEPSGFVLITTGLLCAGLFARRVRRLT